MVSQLEDHQLLEEAVAHHKLLAGTRNVSVVMQQSHTSEARDVHLQGHVSLDVEGSLSLPRWVGTRGHLRVKDVEGLVPNFINHYQKLL